MRAPRQLTILVLVAATAVLSPRSVASKDWNRALADGEILVYTRPVKGSEVPEMIVKAVINSSPEKVWDLVSHCGNYTRTMLRIKAATEVSRKGNAIVCRVTVDMPFPYSDTTATTSVVHQVGGGRWSRRWTLLHGDYTANSGSWVLERYRGDPNRTLVLYSAHAVPRAWVPGWIRTQAQKKTLPEMIARLRKLLGV
jgi:ribosome-associated toxin RatA of RatAB toxin-antitoxin module